MRVDVRLQARPQLDRSWRYAVAPSLLLVIGLFWGTWTAYTLLSGGSQSAIFYAAAGCFVVFAFAFLALQGTGRLNWMSAPPLLTIQALLGFAIMPIVRFATGTDSIDDGYMRAIVQALIGFVAFWAGCALMNRGSTFRFVPLGEDTSSRVAFAAAALLGLGVLGNVILWRSGLFANTTDLDVHASSLGFVQWLTLLANMLPASLIVSAIEMFGKPHPGATCRFVFWISLLTSVGLGAISATKSGTLFPLLYAAMIYTVTRKKLPRSLILLPIFVVMIVFPFVGAFRKNLSAGYRYQFNTVEGLEAAMGQSYEDAFLSFGSTSSSAESENSQIAMARFSHLSYLRDMVTLPVPEMLSGDEKVWLAPIYPLIPRFIWKDKPVFAKGVRLSYLLGNTQYNSSAAMTPIGDLYVMYGTFGVIVGMFVWGISLQLLMNWIIGKDISERRLFFYVIMLPVLLNIEADVVGLIAGTVQYGMSSAILAYVIYGRSETPLRVESQRAG